MASCAMSATIGKFPSAVRAIVSSSKLLSTNASSLGSFSAKETSLCNGASFQPQQRSVLAGGSAAACVRPMATSSAARESSPEGPDSRIQRLENGVPVTKGRTRGGNLGQLAPSAFEFLDLWDPFFPERSLRQMMNTMNRVFRDPLEYSAPVDQQRTPWDVIEDEEGFKLRVDMPGLSKEEVKVTVEEGTLIIKGEHKADEDSKEGNAGTRWSKRSYGTCNTRVTLPENVQLDQIKAELKNGVLYVVVPKTQQKKEVINVDIA